MPKTEAAEARRKMPTEREFVSGNEDDLVEEEAAAVVVVVVADCVAFSSCVAAATLPAKESRGGAWEVVDSYRRCEARSGLRIRDGDDRIETLRCWRTHWRQTNDEWDSWAMALRNPTCKEAILASS